MLSKATRSRASRAAISRSCRYMERRLAVVVPFDRDCNREREHESRLSLSSLPSSGQQQHKQDNNIENFPTSPVRDDFSPINLAVSSKIEGEESQIATITLRPGERLRAESGSMLFMTQGVEMATNLEGAPSAFKRMMTGQNVFLTDFTYNGGQGTGTVALGTDFPSKIIRLSLEEYGGSLIAQRGAYLASNPSVDIQMEFTRTMTAGFFGGQGFILQRLVGEGDVLIKAGGSLIVRDLEEGEVLRATSGSIVAFEPTVSYDIQMMQGVKNVVFGGEGLFITTLTGPGRCWLQGMPQNRMIAEIASRIPSGGGIGPVIPMPIGGMGGGTGGGVEGPPVDAGVPNDTHVPGNTGVDSGEEMVAIADESSKIDPEPFDSMASSGMASDDASTIKYSNTIGESDAFQETTFTDNETDFAEPSFSDDTSFSTDNSDAGFGQQQGEIFDDENMEIFDSGATEEASEAGSSILSTLWDIFTGD